MATTWIFALGPMALVAAALLTLRRPADDGVRPVTIGAGLALGQAVSAALTVALSGAQTSPTIGAAGIGLSLHLDVLSAIMALLVAFVGLIVVLYSRNYLAGDPGQGRFLRWLALTLAAVLILVQSGNLFQLWLAWVATSLALNRLLLFRAERRAAVLAARKKFVVSRLSDALLLLALAGLYRAFGTLDIAAIGGAMQDGAGASLTPATGLAAVALVSAALLKSAQFPLHGWLTEVMETPTPVSALLHAGVINAGGFLVLRCADVVAASPAALDLLIVVGGITALVGSAAMLVQTSVKLSLAWSTIAQMGFMMLECGLGLFPAALLHIVAHSLYKAHAFLSSGSVIELARASWSPSPGGAAHPARPVIAAGLAIVAALATGALFGASLFARPGAVALGVILALGITYLLLQGLDERPVPQVIARVVLAAVLVTGGYLALQVAVGWMTAGVLPATEPGRSALDLVLIALVVAGFALMTVFQARLPGPIGSGRWLGIYVHLSNGFYVNTLANRLAIRLWPGRPPHAPRPQAATGAAQ